MTTQNLLPPVIPGVQLEARLLADGYGVIAAADVAARAGQALGDLLALAPAWNRLTPDAYLRDGGRYRRRRHGSLVVEGDTVRAVPHRAHWQPLDYNALHGGIERWFDPLEEAFGAAPAFAGLVRAFARVAGALKPGAARWFVEAHPFRIDCADGIGRPTPEGAHRDGVDLVVVILVDRHAVRGGETRVFQADGPRGMRFTLAEPFSALVIDDARVIHESTPIQPMDNLQQGWRDTLVLTYRTGGFQDPPTAPEGSKP